MTNTQIIALLRFIFDDTVTLKRVEWQLNSPTGQVHVRYTDSGGNEHAVGINESGTHTTYEV